MMEMKNWSDGEIYRALEQLEESVGWKFLMGGIIPQVMSDYRAQVSGPAGGIDGLVAKEHALGMIAGMEFVYLTLQAQKDGALAKLLEAERGNGRSESEFGAGVGSGGIEQYSDYADGGE